MPANNNRVIPAIPATTTAGDLVRVINERLGRIAGLLDAGAAVRYGTRRARLDADPSALADGTLWVDEGGSGYQLQGNKWVAVFVSTGSAAAAATIQVAYASGNVTLTTTAADVPGVTLTLARSGLYYIAIAFAPTVSTLDAGAGLLGYLNAGGSLQTPVAELIGTANNQSATVFQQWTYQATAGDVVKLQAKKTSGTGSSAAGGQSSISALRVSD